MVVTLFFLVQGFEGCDVLNLLFVFVFVLTCFFLCNGSGVLGGLRREEGAFLAAIVK